jgi:hypothetical protein
MVVSGKGASSPTVRPRRFADGSAARLPPSDGDRVPVRSERSSAQLRLYVYTDTADARVTDHEFRTE